MPAEPTKRELEAAEREARLRFRTMVVALDGACVAHEFPTDCEEELAAHHVITQAHLRKAGRADLLWDPRNGALVCGLAHRHHHLATHRIGRDRLPARCIRFAYDHGFERLLDRYYATAA